MTDRYDPIPFDDEAEPNLRFIIPVYWETFHNEIVQTVNLRNLHEWLEVATRFAMWVKRRIEEYSFKEGTDFRIFPACGKNVFGEGRPAIEYRSTLDMALCIVQKERKTPRQAEAYQYLSVYVDRIVVIREQERREIQFGKMLNQILKDVIQGKIIPQYLVENYRIDFYLPYYKLAVEYDEKRHSTPNQARQDWLRQVSIQQKTGITFIRVQENYEYQGINAILRYTLAKRFSSTNKKPVP